MARATRFANSRSRGYNLRSHGTLFSLDTKCDIAYEPHNPEIHSFISPKKIGSTQQFKKEKERKTAEILPQ